VRKDLSYPQQAVQACHACIDARDFYPADLETPNLVLLGVNDEKKLVNTLRRIEKLGIRCKAFVEPDIGNQLTAIATEPVSGDSRHHFKQYQLFNCKMQPWWSRLAACLMSFFTIFPGGN
jgi:hypothetical protein